MDRQALLEVVAQGVERFDAQVLAYCLMGNHYHFVLDTRAANLSRLMRHVNGVSCPKSSCAQQALGLNKVVQTPPERSLALRMAQGRCAILFQCQKC